MRIWRSRWHTVYAVLCIYASSAWAYRELDDGKHASRELEEDLSQGNSYAKRLIPIKSPRINSKPFATRLLPLEPDAEILPAHYTGVKPPGVDHMELRYAETQISKAGPKTHASGTSNEGGGTQRASTNKNSKTKAGKAGRQRVGSFEKGQKSDRLKEKQKTEYTEAGGRKKSHSDRDDNSKYEEEKAAKKGGGSYRNKGGGNVDRKAAGYRNVYHKDEYKKDHDFYDNDDQGGHLKKHGRYNEKHIAIEGTFKKGDGKNSGLDEVEVRKEGVGKNSRAEGESKGHDARHGYDGFFEKFEGFGKQGDRDEDKMFRFVDPKAR